MKPCLPFPLREPSSANQPTPTSGRLLSGRLLFARIQAPGAALLRALSQYRLPHLHLPLISAQTAALTPELADQISAARSAHWQIFSSPAAVDSAFALAAVSFSSLCFGAVGASTAERLSAKLEQHLSDLRDRKRVRIVRPAQAAPQTWRTEAEGAAALLEQLLTLELSPNTHSAVIFCAPGGLDVLSHGLRNHGWQVQELHSYQRLAAVVSEPERAQLQACNLVFCASGAHWQALRSLLLPGLPQQDGHASFPVQQLWLPSQRLLQVIADQEAHWLSNTEVFCTHGASDAALVKFMQSNSTDECGPVP